MFTRLLSIVLPIAFAAGSAYAQDSLGIQGLQASLSYGMADDGQTVGSGQVKLDVDITQVHGLQLDLGLIDGGKALTGQLGAHLYMRPVQNQKYGFFASISDMDGEAIQYLSVGGEGRIGLSDQLALDLHLGIGGTTGMGGTSANQWDYVFAGGGLLFAKSDATTLEARVDIAEFDELTFRAIGVDSSLRVSHRLNASNFAVFGEARHSALYGTDAQSPITTFQIGVTMDLGRSSQTLMDRPFETPNPFEQLVQRGIVMSF
ncbi:hypothetical protein [Octadecabacter ascidiaceicola]|uniref:Porin domain-containing protein n=1 Tax=Octadecabacter ascidiaceicola TaxID=1655543 RepID=A0A238JLS1_9RHOB|nr:hypothetical protein [Octadecabacter ascidiaceicola]SMX31117.1 hypothetical protein OCA8868_00198 [Octadecabacter ascidiaceicola]